MNNEWRECWACCFFMENGRLSLFDVFMVEKEAAKAAAAKAKAEKAKLDAEKKKNDDKPESKPE